MTDKRELGHASVEETLAYSAASGGDRLLGIPEDEVAEIINEVERSYSDLAQLTLAGRVARKYTRAEAVDLTSELSQRIADELKSPKGSVELARRFTEFGNQLRSHWSGVNPGMSDPSRVGSYENPSPGQDFSAVFSELENLARDLLGEVETERVRYIRNAKISAENLDKLIHLVHAVGDQMRTVRDVWVYEEQLDGDKPNT